MSKRTIIIAVIAVLLFGAALFSCLMDKQPVIVDEDPEILDEQAKWLKTNAAEYQEAKVTAAENGTESDKT